MSQIIRGTAVLVLAAWAWSSLVWGNEQSEWKRPFDEMLPIPSASVSCNAVDELVIKLPDRRSTYILDSESLQPIEGALLWCTAEDEREHAVPYGSRLGEGYSNRDGLVNLVPHGWDQGFNWIAEKAGYGAVRALGTHPPQTLLLRKSPNVEVQILDPLGRPAESVEVDRFPGCPHGPPVHSGRSGSGGVFLLESVNRNGYWGLDLRTFTAGRDDLDGSASMGRRPRQLVLNPRWHVTGRIVTQLGQPIAGAVVRSGAWERGPRTRSDSDGRFVLPGFQPGAELLITPPGASTPLSVQGSFGPSPFTLQLDPSQRTAALPERVIRIAIRIESIEAQPGADQWIRVTRATDGWSILERAARADGDNYFIANILLPSGECEVVPATPFGPVSFDSQKVSGTTETVTIAGRAQPRLEIIGDVPAEAIVRLAVTNSVLDKPNGVELIQWLPNLPAHAETVVQVWPSPAEDVVYFFPVRSLTEHNVRTASIQLPLPRSISVLGVAAGADLDLTCDGLQVGHSRMDETILTYALGPMRLVVDSHERDAAERSFEFELAPSDDSVPIVLHWKDGKIVDRTVFVEFFPPNEFDVANSHVVVETDGVTWSEPLRNSVTAIAPCRIVATIPGHQTFERVFTGPAHVEYAWGSCSISLSVRNAEGTPAPAIVAVDGVHHWTAHGQIRLAGLVPGQHDLRIAPVQEALRGQWIRLNLREGENLKRSVILPSH